MLNSIFARIVKILESLPVIGTGVRSVQSIFDYVWVFYQLGKWMLTKEIFKLHLDLNYDALPDMSNRNAVITGGTRGIGAEIVRKLLQLKMTVIIGCRNPQDGHKLINKLRSEGVKTGSAEILPLDLNSLESVRNFAQSLLDKGKPINLLINNAGIMGVPFSLTPDRFESHFQVNYLSHFLLTNLLLPKMIESAAERRAPIGRIVNVSAAAMYYGKVDLNDLELRSRFNPFIAYFNSKLYQVLMSRHLDSKLQNDGAKVRINSVHPGVVATELVSHLSWFSTYLGWVFERLLMTPAQGADDVLYAAVTPETSNEGGEFFVHKKLCTRGNEYFSARLQRNLWEVSAGLVGLNGR